MKKLLKSLAVAGFCALASQASALSVGDAFYLGSINDGIPSNPANEVSYINDLITLAAGAGNTVIGTETYNRVGSTLAGPFPTATVTGGIKDETTPFSLNVTGFRYVLGKYDASQAGTLVWFNPAGFSGTITAADLPATFNGLGLSHISAYNPGGTGPGTPVPDGGATVALLGLGIAALGFSRRLINR